MQPHTKRTATCWQATTASAPPGAMRSSLSCDLCPTRTSSAATMKPTWMCRPGTMASLRFHDGACPPCPARTRPGWMLCRRSFPFPARACPSAWPTPPRHSWANACTRNSAPPCCPASTRMARLTAMHCRQTSAVFGRRTSFANTFIAWPRACTSLATTTFRTGQTSTGASSSTPDLSGCRWTAAHSVRPIPC